VRACSVFLQKNDRDIWESQSKQPFRSCACNGHRDTHACVRRGVAPAAAAARITGSTGEQWQSSRQLLAAATFIKRQVCSHVLWHRRSRLLEGRQEILRTPIVWGLCHSSGFGPAAQYACRDRGTCMRVALALRTWRVTKPFPWSICRKVCRIFSSTSCD
jgi:hypothetical protein